MDILLMSVSSILSVHLYLALTTLVILGVVDFSVAGH